MLILLILPIINIYLLIKHQSTRHMVYINISSLIAEAYFFCLIMQLSLLPDYISRFYNTVSHFLLFIIFFVMSLAFLLKHLKSTHTNMDTKLSPRLDDVFQIMEDSVFIADREGIIVNMNQSAINFVAQQLSAETFQQQTNKINTLTELSLLISNKLSFEENNLFLETLETTSYPKQIELTINETAYWLLTTPIYTGASKHSASIGVNLVFHNIQEEKNLSSSLELQNYELTLANEALRKNIKIANALEEQKERLNLIRELQNSIIQSIEKVTDSILQFKNHSEHKTVPEYQYFIVTVGENLRNIFKNVRTSIQKLSNKN